MHSGQEWQRTNVFRLVHHTRRCMMSVYPVAGDGNLFKVTHIRLCLCKVSIFPFVINN